MIIKSAHYEHQPRSPHPTIRMMRKLSTRQGFIDEVYTRLPAEKTMVEAYWSVEYDHMSFFDRPRYSGHESFKTQLSKARKKRFIF